MDEKSILAVLQKIDDLEDRKTVLVAICGRDPELTTRGGLREDQFMTQDEPS